MIRDVVTGMFALAVWAAVAGALLMAGLPAFGPHPGFLSCWALAGALMVAIRTAPRLKGEKL